MGNRIAIPYSEDELAFIKANCTLRIADLTSQFNAAFDRDISAQNIHGLRKRKGWKTGRTGRYQKGAIPFNKGKKMDCGPNRTSFKKGQKPHNYLPVGTTRITADGYTQRKMTDTGYPPRDWVEVHRLLWVEHHGSIPDNHLVLFIDGDKTNIVIDNLILVNRGEHAVINKNRLRELPSELKHSGINLGRLIHKTARRKKLICTLDKN